MTVPLLLTTLRGLSFSSSSCYQVTAHFFSIWSCSPLFFTGVSESTPQKTPPTCKSPVTFCFWDSTSDTEITWGFGRKEEWLRSWYLKAQWARKFQGIRATCHHFILSRWRNLRIHVLTCMRKLWFEENLIAVDTLWTLCGSLASRGTEHPVRIAKASISKLYSAKYKCFPVTSYVSVTWN